jgi:membrane peptidoglycan carboxypeptidase
MIGMLGGVVQNGTGTPAQACGYACGGKTGTTQDGRDAWWVGFTPDLSAAIWVGNDDYSPCPEASGSGFCAPIWAKFIRGAMESLGYDGKFPEGSGVVATRRVQQEEKPRKPEARAVTVCADSGGLAGPHCPHTYEKALSQGESVPAPCTIHGASTRSSPSPKPATSGGKLPPGGGSVTVLICADSGKLAGPYCPRTEERAFAGGHAPTGTCTTHTGNGH